MRLTYWIAEARTGDVVGQVECAGSASLTTKLGGGTCTVPLRLAYDNTAGDTDWGHVGRIIAWTRPGLHSLVAADEKQRILGEWVIMSRQLATDSESVTVDGMTWEGYPALRSLNANYIATGSQLALAKTLLTDAFTSFNAGMAITVPTVSSSVPRTIKWRSHEGYYSDVLDEIASPVDGFEWAVDVTGTWSGSALTKVNRAVVFGQPVLARASSLELVAGEPGTRHGNCVIGGGDDFSRYAQSVYGIGAGEGDKQPWVGLSDPTLTNAGYLNSTKNVSFPGTTDAATLTDLTEAALEEAQNLADPFDVTARLDALTGLPAVGYSVRLVNPRSLAWPDGLDAQLRVGQVQINAAGPIAETVRLLAA